MASTIGLPSYFGQVLAGLDVPDLCWKRPLLLVVTGGMAVAVADHLAAVHPLVLLDLHQQVARLGAANQIAKQAALRVSLRLLREQKSVLLTGVSPTEELVKLAQHNRGGFQAVHALAEDELPPKRLVGKRPFVCHPDEVNLRHLLRPLHQELRQRLGNEAWWSKRYDKFLY